MLRTLRANVKLQTDHKALQVELARRDAEIATLRAMRSQHKERIAELEAENDLLEEQVEEWREVFHDLKRQNNELSKKVASSAANAESCRVALHDLRVAIREVVGW